MRKILFYLTGSCRAKLIVTAVIFVILVILLSSFHAASDGFDRVGFPFIFYQHNGGKCDNCAYLNWFKVPYLLLDLISCFVLSSFIIEIYKMLFRKKHNVGHQE